MEVLAVSIRQEKGKGCTDWKVNSETTHKQYSYVYKKLKKSIEKSLELINKDSGYKINIH